MTSVSRFFVAFMVSVGLFMAVPQASMAQSGKKVVIGFSQVGAETEWRVAMSKVMKETFAKEKEMELLFSDAQQKQENQLKALRTFILQKVDFIVFAPVVQTGWDAVLKEAKEANIPVIVINRMVKTSAIKLEDYTVTFIGPDNQDAGRFAANVLLDKFKNASGTVNVVQLEGTVGSSTAVERKAGFMEVVGAQNKLKVIKTQSGDFTRARGKEVMEAFLKSTKAEGVKIDALFSHSDDMGIGAMQAIEEAGLKPGKDILIVAIDGVKGAFEAMIAGKQVATIENPVDYAKPLIQVVRDYQNKKPIPPWVKLSYTIYPAEVAAKELPNRLY